MKREKSSDIIAEICTEANIRQSIRRFCVAHIVKRPRRAAGWEYKAAIDWENYVTA